LSEGDGDNKVKMTLFVSAVNEVVQVKAAVFLLQQQCYSWTLILLFSTPLVLWTWRSVTV